MRVSFSTASNVSNLFNRSIGTAEWNVFQQLKRVQNCFRLSNMEFDIGGGTIILLDMATGYSSYFLVLKLEYIKHRSNIQVLSLMKKFYLLRTSARLHVRPHCYTNLLEKKIFDLVIKSSTILEPRALLFCPCMASRSKSSGKACDKSRSDWL